MIGSKHKILHFIQGIMPMPSMDKMIEQRRQAIRLLQKINHETAHAFHVSKLALDIFDQLQSLHQLGIEEKTLLECAALLHDIGWAISGVKHHKHSLRMILNADLPALSEREKRIVANVARYHRRSLPKPSHPPFMLLCDADRFIVKKLAAFLRIADALDDAHKSHISAIECTISHHDVTIHAESPDPCMNEYAGMERKKDLFIETFNKNILFEVHETAGEMIYLQTIKG